MPQFVASFEHQAWGSQQQHPSSGNTTNPLESACSSIGYSFFDKNPNNSSKLHRGDRAKADLRAASVYITETAIL